MTAVFSSLLSVWEFWKLHPGIVLVLAGVTGEGIEVVIKLRGKTLSERCERRLKVVEFTSWAVVVIGLAMEMSEAVKSDNEVIELKQQIAQIDPLNVPIHSVRAVVFLLVKGDFSNDPLFFPNNSLVKGAIPVQGELSTEGVNFMILGKGGSWLDLDCDRIESTEFMHGRRFSMTFSWPSASQIALEMKQDKWDSFIPRNHLSTADLDKSAVQAGVLFFGIHKGMEILEGTCEITINGEIPREFSEPKIVDMGLVGFSVMQKPAP